MKEEVLIQLIPKGDALNVNGNSFKSYYVTPADLFLIPSSEIKYIRYVTVEEVLKDLNSRNIVHKTVNNEDSDIARLV